MEITYLLNSGFMIKDKDTLMLFDDFDDPSLTVDKVIGEENFKYLYIFVSHAHFDHFGTHIRAYAPQTTKYIFSYDLKRTRRVKLFPAEKIAFMRKYSNFESEGIKVTTFDSTDVGVSFLVELKGGKKIFHAGDFNWWHWDEDSPENRQLAERVFVKQMKRLEGLQADIAFFPVDGRLGGSQEKGVTEFIKQTEVKTLVAMHRVGFPAWIPSRNFLKEAGKIPYWSPTYSGEFRKFEKNKFIEV